MAVADGAADLQRWRVPPVYQLLSGGTLLPGTHHNKVWRGLAQVPGNTEPGISLCIKWVRQKEVLATELACSLAAQALRLQVPRGVLVIADKDQLPGISARVSGGPTDKVLCFGSELQWPDDTLARPVGREAVEEWVWRRLCGTPQGPLGAVWDELVANEDRHFENVVFDGHRWWLIDHEFTLAPVAKAMKKFTEPTVRRGLIDYHPEGNTLAFEVLSRRKDHNIPSIPATLNSSKQRLLWMTEQARVWRTGIGEVDTVLLMAWYYLSTIELRLPALPLHLDDRLRNPTKPLKWTSSSSQSTGLRSATKRRPA
jgi:hypothetical protein